MRRTLDTAFILVSLSGCFIATGRPSKTEQGRPLRQDYEVRDVVAPDALIRLGELYDQPMGIVCGNNKIATTTLVTARTPNATPQEAMVALIRQLPEYEWKERSGVMVAQPRLVPPVTRGMLNTIIPSIAAQNIDIEALSFRLWMELQLQVDPESRTRGFAGVGHMRDYFELGEMNLNNIRIEEVLDEIVRRRRSAAWVVLPPPATLKGTPRERIWSIVTYANPPQPLERLCCLNQEYFK
jgi:hypothetical protein